MISFPIPTMPYCCFGAHRIACAAVAAAIGLSSAPRSCAAATSDPVRAAIRQRLPRYDPTIREQHVATERERAARISAAESTSTPAGTTQDIISLPRIVVRPRSDDADAVPLPRVPVTRPLNNVKIDEHLTPAARDAQLVKKHLSSLDRDFLNRYTLPLFGRSKESRARNAEAIEAGANALNAIAELIEQEGAEARDPEEQKKLKQLYLDLYIARPK